MKRAERSSGPIRRRRLATSSEQHFFCSSGKSMLPPPSHKTAEVADPPPTRTGAATRTKTTSSGPVAASARPGKWLLRRRGCGEYIDKKHRALSSLSLLYYWPKPLPDTLRGGLHVLGSKECFPNSPHSNPLEYIWLQKETKRSYLAFQSF